MTSIIIPTLNHLEDILKPCLQSIIANTDMSTTEVIVVANGCTDGTQEYVKSLNLKLLDYKDPLGYTKAVNEGLKHATGEYVVLLNNDTVILGPNWLDILRKPFEQDPNTGITGPVKFTWDCGGIIRTAIAFWCCMFKKSLIDEIGYLDPIFNPGMGEDGDFSVKAELIGYKLVDRKSVV